MINSHQISSANGPKRCVVALHCSLGSGRQWTKLADQLGSNYRLIAPDISGYGDNAGPVLLPLSLAEEVALLSERLDQIDGPFHLVGHSYGGAITFKIATASRFANQVRSLTLIEPVLPTLLPRAERTGGCTNCSRDSRAAYRSICGTGCRWRRSTSSSRSGTDRDRRKSCRRRRACA